MSSGRRAELLFVGRPVPEKGLADTLAALAHVRHHCWHFTIVGEILAGIDVDAWAPLVTWLGCVPNRKVASIMATHDILVVPSHYETFGNVALEGLASAMIVVASYTGGFKTLIEHGQTGFHFRAGDVADLARTLDFVIENLMRLADVRKNARASAIRYSWDEIVRQTAELLARYI
jgi:glycosyltransferase involved in cell wall biosynthesis